MTDEERREMQQRARERAAEYSYEDKISGKLLEIRKAPKPNYVSN